MPTKELWTPVAWMISWFVADMRQFYHGWNIRVHVKNDRSKKELGLKYRDVKDTLIDMGYSLIKFGFVEDKTQKE